MKSKPWSNHLVGAIFAFVLSVCTVGNLVTGYDLEAASMVPFILWCACCALVCAFLFGFKYGEIALLCLTVLLAPVLWKDGVLWDELQSLCYTVSAHYHNIHGWPIIGEAITDGVDRPLMVLSFWTAVSVSWCLCRRKNIFIALPSVILPLVACLITTDKLPDEIYLYLLILGIAVMLMTDWTRRREPAQEARLTLRIIVPVAAALALLFVLVPQKEYVNHAAKLQKEVVSWFEKLLDAEGSTNSGAPAGNEKLNLRRIGPRSRLSRFVMRVNAPTDGTIYLRGRDYDIYSGTGWESSVDREESFTTGRASFGKLSVVTHGILDVLYVPYYSAEEVVLVGGALNNDEGIQRYSYDLSHTASGRSNVPDAGYMQLPFDTLQWVSDLDVIRDIQTDSQSEKIRRIESFVRNAAVYDLTTPTMRPDHKDFAQWFLEESETGYCVHFATAATVLLRAAGIPARYVEGYMLTCKAGKYMIVQSRDAHAWAEYYDSVSGVWRILEATPADLQEEETETTTEPDETQPYTFETETAPSHDETTAPHTGEETHPTVRDDISDDDPLDSNKGASGLSGWIKTLFWIVLTVALVPIQSYIRIGWKRKRWNHGRSNEKLIIRWKQTRKMARLIHYPFPEKLELLAQKASFSQHRIRTGELQLFDDYRKDLLAALCSKPWYQKLLLRWVYAIGR